MRLIPRLVILAIIVSCAGTAAQLLQKWVDSIEQAPVSPHLPPGPNIAESAAAGLFFALLVFAGIAVLFVRVEPRER